jgi:hypothetical protein
VSLAAAAAAAATATAAAAATANSPTSATVLRRIACDGRAAAAQRCNSGVPAPAVICSASCSARRLWECDRAKWRSRRGVLSHHHVLQCGRVCAEGGGGTRRAAPPPPPTPPPPPPPPHSTVSPNSPRTPTCAVCQ